MTKESLRLTKKHNLNFNFILRLQMFPFHNTEHFVPLYTAIKGHRNSTQTYKIGLTNSIFFCVFFKYVNLYPGTVPNHSKIVSVKCIQSYLQRNIWSKCLRNPDYVCFFPERDIYTQCFTNVVTALFPIEHFFYPSKTHEASLGNNVHHEKERNLHLKDMAI